MPEAGPDGTVAEGAAPADPGQAPLVTTDPRTVLQTLVRDALERSHAVGAANMLAAAAQSDIEEAAAGQRIQASLTAGVGPGGSQSLAGTETSAIQVRAALTVSQLLYDGGRVDRLTDWRTQLAESARQGHLSASEQLAMTTVSLALERSRYRQHVVVYGQYVRKMGCLLEPSCAPTVAAPVNWCRRKRTFSRPSWRRARPCRRRGRWKCGCAAWWVTACRRHKA